LISVLFVIRYVEPTITVIRCTDIRGHLIFGQDK
jgi:hypothetical protein